MTLQRTVADNQPIHFDLKSLTDQIGGSAAAFLSGISDLVGVGGSANLAVSVTSTLHLDFGIDLSDPAAPTPVIYDSTSWQLDARLAGTAMTFQAAAGPLGLFIKNGTVTLDADGLPGTAAPARFQLGLKPNLVNHRYGLSEIGTSQIDLSLQAGVKADLPVFFPTDSDRLNPNLSITIPSLSQLFQGNTSQVTVTAPDLAAALSSLSLGDSLGSAALGLDKLLEVLQNALNGEVFGIPLPLVGTSLKEGAQFVQKMREELIPLLQGGAGARTIGLIQQALFNALGPPGLRLLVLNKDFDDQGADGVPDSAPDYHDVEHTKSADQIQFNLNLHSDLVSTSVPIGFDLGVPALNLKVDGRVKLMIGFDFKLSFGVSRRDGFYLDTSRVNELRVSIDVTTPGLNASGNLFFLHLNAKDDPAHPSHFGGAFLVEPIISSVPCERG